MNNKLTLKSVRTQLASYNVTITKRDSEYKVRIKGSPRDHGYYTNDLKDALDTGLLMAAQDRENKRQEYMSTQYDLLVN